MELEDWLEEASEAGFVWYLKRLSGNDTQLTGGHQAGPYIPKELAFRLMPHLTDTSQKNPRGEISLTVLPDGFEATSNIIYYNNKFHENPASGRNETRLTGLGGKENPLLEPDNTGALVVFAFELVTPVKCQVWICRNHEEEVQIEDVVGPIEPGEPVIWEPGRKFRSETAEAHAVSCTLEPEEIPEDWIRMFPSGMEIIGKAISLRPDLDKPADERILRRRDCEYEVFRSVERAFYTPEIRKGFSTLDEFLAVAQTVLQSRKSRAGKSLEYHAKAIFEEEGLKEGVDYEYNPKIEGNKKPDFLFPTVAKYNDPTFPAEKLTVLAAKTTCKDRWRQVLNEADRVPTKYLLTLQEGISENQFFEMKASGVKLVVPGKLQNKYPESVRGHIWSLDDFLSNLKRIAE